MFTEYSTKMGSTTRVITLTYFVATVLFCVVFLNLQPVSNWTIPLLLVSLPFAVFLYMWLRRVVSYKVFDQEIVVCRFSGEYKVAISEIQELSHPTINFFKLRKIWGNGGVFSFSGTYSYKGIGRFKGFVTDWENAVLLNLGSKKIMISPNKLDEFLDEVSSKLETRN